MNNRKAHISHSSSIIHIIHNEIWYFESHLLATTDVELIKQHLRLIIDKIKGGGVLMAEDKFAVEYFSSAFSLASSFYDDMSHQIVFGPIYEELIPLGLAKKKTEDEEAAFSKRARIFPRSTQTHGGSTTDSTATASSTMRRVKD